MLDPVIRDLASGPNGQDYHPLIQSERVIVKIAPDRQRRQGL